MPAGLRAALLIPASLAVVTLALFVWWPAGVVLGLAFGIAVVVGMGGAQQRAAQSVPVDEELTRQITGPVPIQVARPAATKAPAPSAGVAIAAAQAVAPPAAAPAARVAAAAAAPQVARVAEAVPAPDRPAPAAARTPAAAAPTAPAAAPSAAAPLVTSGVRGDLDRLKAEMGDDYPDFARAARLVVSTQYASAARLQRDLHLPYSRARRLLAGLETEHFVGPATGTLPRQVLLPKERLPEVERLFAGV